MENHWTCEEVEIFLPELVRDRLPIQETDEIRDHLQNCPLCRTSYLVAIQDEQRFSVLLRSSVVNEESIANHPITHTSNPQNNISDFIWFQLVGRITGLVSIVMIVWVLYLLYHDQLQPSFGVILEYWNETSFLYNWWAKLYTLPDLILGWLPETWLFLIRNLISLLVPIGAAWFLYGLFFWQTNKEAAR